MRQGRWDCSFAPRPRESPVFPKTAARRDSRGKGAQGPLPITKEPQFQLLLLTAGLVRGKPAAAACLDLASETTPGRQALSRVKRNTPSHRQAGGDTPFPTPNPPTPNLRGAAAGSGWCSKNCLTSRMVAARQGCPQLANIPSSAPGSGLKGPFWAVTVLQPDPQQSRTTGPEHGQGRARSPSTLF